MRCVWMYFGAISRKTEIITSQQMTPAEEVRRMIVKRKDWKSLCNRIEKLEKSEELITTAEHGKKSLKWYIRMLSSSVKSDPSMELRSWED